MKLRARKAVGIFASVIYITVYCLLVMAFGGGLLFAFARSNMIVEFFFYVVMGLAWLPGEMAIIKWMSRPDPA